MEGNEEKKKYTVVDKRLDLDDVEPATDEPAAKEQPKAEQPVPGKESTLEAPPHADESAMDETSNVKEDGGAPEMKMSDAMRMVLSMIRERVFMSLGLVISKNRPGNKDLQEVDKLSTLFGSLVDGNMEKLGPDELGDSEGGKIPSPGELLEFSFGVIQSQTVVRMGLMADPATGLIARDLTQARQGIDFISSLVQNAGDLLSPEQAKRMEATLTDLRINYVNILKQS